MLTAAAAAAAAAHCWSAHTGPFVLRPLPPPTNRPPSKQDQPPSNKSIPAISTILRSRTKRALIRPRRLGSLVAGWFNGGLLLIVDHPTQLIFILVGIQFVELSRGKYKRRIRAICLGCLAPCYPTFLAPLFPSHFFQNTSCPEIYCTSFNKLSRQIPDQSVVLSGSAQFSCYW